MAAESSKNLAPVSTRGDLLVAASAWSLAFAGLAFGVNPLTVAVAVLALPMVAFLAFGHLAGRGGVVACMATALGMGMAATGPGVSSWAAVGLIGMVDLAAVVAGTAAVRMAPAPMPAAVAAESPWSSVVVRHEAAAAGQVSPFVTPLPNLNLAKRRKTRGPAALERSA